MRKKEKEEWRERGGGEKEREKEKCGFAFFISPLLCFRDAGNEKEKSKEKEAEERKRMKGEGERSETKREGGGRGGGRGEGACAMCGKSVVAEWRRGISGERDVCNGCGLYVYKHLKKTGQKLWRWDS
jgi:hypothetical protein